MDAESAEILFASPKINPAIVTDLAPCIEDINTLFAEFHLDYKMRVIAHDEFNTSILQPILLMSDGIADTSELFLRSYQMYTMFASDTSSRKQSIARTERNKPIPIEKTITDEGAYKELKIGQLANTVLRRILEEGLVSEDEVAFMQKPEYSKQFFDLQYPVLLRTDERNRELRYYKEPVIIHGKRYRICSEWFETPANNDRPYLLRWIEKHSKPDGAND